MHTSNSKLDELVDWFRWAKDNPCNWNICAPFNQLHPRVVFFKSVPDNARFHDVGAGSGNLAVFKDWLMPPRPDIRLTGISLLPGEKQHLYEKWIIDPWTRNLAFDGAHWDAIYASHFIEHIDDQFGFLEWSVANLKPGGQLYLEWPSPATRELPRRALIKEMTGVDMLAVSFYDDQTHLEKTPGSAVFADYLRQLGMLVEKDGIIIMPYFQDKLLQEYFAMSDDYLAQAAWFLKTGWCSHIVARKPG